MPSSAGAALLQNTWPRLAIWLSPVQWIPSVDDVSNRSCESLLAT